MSYTANITPGRFRAQGIYLVASAYRQLKDGAINILLGPTGSCSFVGTLGSCNGGRQGYVICPDIYTKESQALPLLPLQLGDRIYYDVNRGQIRIVSIKRCRTLSPASPTSGSARVSKPTASPPAKSTVLPKIIVPGLPTYLSSNSARIIGIKPQILPPWNASYNGRTEDVMARLYKRFPNRSIQRADVVELSKDWNDPELALVAAMVWGGINATRPDRAGFTDLDKLLRHQPKDAVQKMNQIRNRIIAGELKQAFVDCSSGGQSKFEGIAISYFTKIFFFLGEALSAKPRPLVLDKWTKNAFFLLLVQAEGLAVAGQWFRLPQRCEFSTAKEMPLRGGIAAQANAYVEFVTRMNSWAAILGVSPGQLEQFVFGEDLRRNREPSNPRMEILTGILQCLP